MIHSLYEYEKLVFDVRASICFQNEPGRSKGAKKCPKLVLKPVHSIGSWVR